MAGDVLEITCEGCTGGMVNKLLQEVVMGTKGEGLKESPQRILFREVG